MEQVGYDYRKGLITAVSCWLASIAAMAFHFDEPWWAAISAWIISHTDPGMIRSKGLMRIAGTVAGATIGYCVSIQTVGRPLPQGFCIFAIAVAGTYMRFRAKYSYSWMLGSITALLVVMESMESVVPLYKIAQYRAYEIVTGVVVVLLVHGVMEPLLGLGNPFKNGKALIAADVDRKKAFNTAMVAGFTVIVIVVLWAHFQLPSLTQCMVTALVLIDLDDTASRKRARLRLLGCLLGGVSGIAGCIYAGDSFLLWSLFFGLCIMSFARLHLSTSPWAYVGTQAGVALIIAMVTGFGPATSLLPIVNRVTGMLVGVGVVILVSSVAAFLEKYVGNGGRNSLPGKPMAA